MKEIISKIFSDFPKIELENPTNIYAIENVESHFSIKFPDDYKNFLLLANGLEGETNKDYIVIWPIEELLILNQAYHVNEFISNVIIFGSNGAEDAYGFYIDNNDKFSVIMLPFIGMGYIKNEKISDTFKEFLLKMIL